MTDLPPTSKHDPTACEAADSGPPGDGSASDPLYEQTAEVVLISQRASLSLVQRHLKIGYNQPARLMISMKGFVVRDEIPNRNPQTVEGIRRNDS